MIRRFLLLALLAASLLVPPGRGADTEFDYEIRMLGLFITQSLAETPLNPGNFGFFLARSQAQGHFRPDLFYRVDKLELSAKPRAIVTRRTSEPRTATLFRDAQESDVFMNEWFFRYRFSDNLFGSIGRENLLWGPSRLLSPSNPFRERNGRTEPQFELPGLDYARMVWVASDKYTFSAIANIGKGRLASFGDWRETYAFKTDWTGDKKQAGLVLSHRVGGDASIGQLDKSEDVVGLYGLVHTSKAHIAYLEGSHDEKDTSILVGNSYNFGGGKVAVLEYFHDGRGLIFNATNFGRPNQGKGDNYALAQFSDDLHGTDFNWTLRLDHAFEDGSSRFYAFLNWADSDFTEFFINGHVNFGGDEFGYKAFLDRQILLGIKYTF